MDILRNKLHYITLHYIKQYRGTRLPHAEFERKRKLF